MIDETLLRICPKNFSIVSIVATIWFIVEGILEKPILVGVSRRNNGKRTSFLSL